MQVRGFKSGSRKVLIVEDDRDIRETLRILLEWEGFEVDSACDGRQAIERLKTFPGTKVILLDLMMPVMDGWEFLKIRRGDPALSGIPVVVVSAIAERCEVAGAAAVLNKPVDIERLLNIVERHCA